MPTENPDPVRIRTGTPADAAAIWRLVGASGALEQNTAYAYVLLCSHFGRTCVVAEMDGAVVGFVAAYRPPVRPEAVFVWQVGVVDRARGRGIAGRMLDALVRLPACRDVRFLEATVTPSNGPSQALFTAFARRHDAPCVVGDGFGPELFPGTHEAEHAYRIGPLNLENQS